MSTNRIKNIIETYLGADMPREVRQRYFAWLRDPASHKEKEQELENYWDNLHVEAEADRAKKLEQLHRAMDRNERKHATRLWLKISAAAAVLLLAVGANYLVVENYLRTKIETNIVTSAYDKGEYTLPDGSKIWLNAGSSLRYYGDMKGRKRIVKLEGEAYFQVQHDAQHPFILETEDLNVEVLGTEFDVINYAEFSTTEVILCKGRVRASGGNLDREIVMKPGERLIYTKKTGTTQLKEVSTASYSQWMGEQLTFDNTPLTEILTSLQRWYAVEIDYPEAWANEVRMSFALIRNENIDEILKAMSLVIKIDYAREGRMVKIRPQ